MHGSKRKRPFMTIMLGGPVEAWDDDGAANHPMNSPQIQPGLLNFTTFGVIEIGACRPAVCEGGGILRPLSSQLPEHACLWKAFSSLHADALL